MDDEDILILRDLAAAYDAARRLAVNLFATHYKSQSPDWKLAPDFLGVIHQIDNMTAGLVKSERVTYPPNFRMRMETFFRRHDMDDKPQMDDREYFSENAAGPRRQAESSRRQGTQELRAKLPGAETSERIASIAGHLVQITADDLHLLPGAGRDTLASDIRAVAASALRQHETANYNRETFYARLLIENKELQERKAKLWHFIQTLGFLDLPSDEQARLRKQHTAMDQYAQILTERISNARHIQKLRDGQASASELLEKQYEAAQQTKSIPASIAEQIDENVRVTGGGKSEEPLPFKD